MQGGRKQSGYPDPDQFEATDTLPMPVLDDTVPDMPAFDDTLPSMPVPRVPARQVDASDLAGSLRERERDLAQAQRRMAALEAELALKEDALRVAQAKLQVAPAQSRSSEEPANALHPELAALRRQNERLHESLASVHGQLGVRESMLAEAEEALAAAIAARPAPAALARQADAPDWQARCVELEAMLCAERASAAGKVEAHELRFAAIEAELAAVREQLAAAPAPSSEARVVQLPRPIGSALRVLVREEGGTEVVYPLGRHTTVGRTPDNDIQVDTTYVSRHHAVLLSGLDHCIIEDLNSTNGLQVNGQRVDRQLLHDGDIVTIGRTHFRYQTSS